MIKSLKRKKLIKVLQFLAAYLVACWTFLQFVDWILYRYDISPYWVDMLLWIFVGIIPSLLIYLYNQERINDKILILREKIIFPLNILLIMVVTYFGFGNSDLGATTKEISYTNDAGELKKQLITKEEFRVSLPVFEFEENTQDSSKLWMKYIINDLLLLDLEQDKNITPRTLGGGTLTDKVNSTNAFSDYFVDGEFEIADSIYIISPVIRSSKNGKELHRQTFTGTDFFNLIDDVSIYVRDNVGIIQEMRDQYIDLDVKDFTTSSLEALKEYTYGRHDNATKIDSTFSLSYYVNAVRGTYFSWSEVEEQHLMDKAYEYRRKLPLQTQLKVLIQRHIAYNHWEEAEELVKLQLEIDPNDVVYSNLLYTIYSETKNFDAFLKFAESRFNEHPNAYAVFMYKRALLVNGEYDKFIDEVKKYQLLLPNNNEIFPYMTEPLILKGDLVGAEKNLKKTILVHPDGELINDLHQEVITYQNSPGFDAKNYSHFFGEFRSTTGEQIVEYFEYNDRFLSHSSNQILDFAIIAGENKVIYTYPDENISVSHEFQKNSKGEIFRIKAEQYYSYKDKETYWFHKESEIIKKADSLLKANNYEQAEVTYLDAISKHPENYYLKNVLAHIIYIKNTDLSILKKQYEHISGTYGTRKFWIENKKLFSKQGSGYKREILPISNKRYFTLSRYNFDYEFEFLEDNNIASFLWYYDEETMEWTKLDDENNYLLKDE